MKTKYLTLILLLTCGCGCRKSAPSPHAIHYASKGVQPNLVSGCSGCTISTNTTGILMASTTSGVMPTPAHHHRYIPYCDDIKVEPHNFAPKGAGYIDTPECILKRYEYGAQEEKLDFYKGWLEVFRKLAIKEGDYKP